MGEVTRCLDGRRLFVRRFTDAEAAEVRRRHEAGATVNALRRQYGCETKTIRKAIVRAGGVVTPRPYRRRPREADALGVRVVRKSDNAKIGRAAATYAGKQTCPPSCPFRQAGCYAAHTNANLTWREVTAEAGDASPLELAEVEARLIRRAKADRHLRLHVAGDSPTREGSRAIAGACEDYVARGREAGLSLTAWGYTHCWRQVGRSDWGGVAMLASCETPADVREAWARGYAAAVVVTDYPDRKAFRLGEGPDTVTVVPWPAETSGRTCSDCRLCFDDGRLHARRLAIGFATHGGGKRQADAALKRRALPMA
jgi:hypothetical protein